MAEHSEQLSSIVYAVLRHISSTDGRRFWKTESRLSS